MGRRRKDGNPLGLERRVYWHHGQFIYRHRDGSAEALGTDVNKANERARIYNDPERRFGTVGYFIDLYIAEAKAGRLQRAKRRRTIEDYEESAELLKASFEKVSPLALVDAPHLIAEYRNKRTAKIRANRELSMLSAMFAWLIESGLCPGLKDNPVRLIAKNPERPKERYVEDFEFQRVCGIAGRELCMAMMLIYRTLQRPADVLSLSAVNVREKSFGGRSVKVISLRQQKTNRPLDIEVTPEIDEALHMLTRQGNALGQWRITASITRAIPAIVHTRKGRAYTTDGIAAMLRRTCIEAGVKPFGLMDLRGKGATDMYLAGVPLEKIQALMGHTSVHTTEIYIKRLMRQITVVMPNTLKMAG